MNTMTLRQWHGYLGVFIAPSVLFFALTGSLQLFTLHETHGGYRAPAIIERLGRLHKDQVITLPHRRETPAPVAPSRERRPAAAPEQGPRPATLLLKIFFLLVAVQLVTSTGMGLWIAFARNRDRRLTWFLLLAGVLVPLALIVA
ncbi:MAG: PepSY protein [Caulobacteraceae bacterium]|jgi:hypothetical protein|nr:PepSY protein [Caulobacteraceae bacterium]